MLSVGGAEIHLGVAGADVVRLEGREVVGAALGEEEYAEAVKWLSKVDMSDVYAGNAADAEGEAFCTTDACLMPEHNDE